MTGESNAPLRTAAALKHWTWLAPFIIVALAALPRLAALGAGWVWDDELIWRNPLVVNLGGIVDIWFHPARGVERGIRYWPVYYTSFWLEYRLWGAWSAGYHLTNLLLHAANSLLLWALMRRWAPAYAFAAAALFAVHPLHTETVVWAAERKGLLAGFFSLTSVLAWDQFRVSQRPRWAIATVLAFLLAVLSKPVLLGLPVVILLLEWGCRRVPTRAQWGLAGVLAVVSAGFAISTLLLSRQTERVDLTLGFAARLLIASRSAWFYPAYLVWPASLLPVYPRWPTSIAQPEAWIYLGGWLVVLSTLAWFGFARGARLPFACVAAYLLLLAPVSGIIGHGFMSTAYVADRYAYIPSIPLLALASWGLMRLNALRRNVGWALLTVFLAAGAAKSAWYTPVFRDMGTLFRTVLATNPTVQVGWYNLGNLDMDAENFTDAMIKFRRASELDPHDAKPLVNHALCLIKSGGSKQEIRTLLEEAHRRDPSNGEALVHLGIMAVDTGDTTAAIAMFQAALKADPLQWTAFSELGMLQAQAGDLAAARTSFQSAVQVAPNEATPRVNYAIALLQSNLPAEAVEQLRTALQLDPKNETARNLLNQVRPINTP